MGTWDEATEEYRVWMQAGGRRAGTIRLRLHYLDHLAQCCPDPWLVTLDDLTRFLACSSWSPQTRKSARASVRGFFRWAAATGRITADPSVLLPSVLVPHRAATAPGEASVDAAIGRASDRDRLMLLLGSRAGLRRAEIAGLAWADVTGTSLLVRGKGGRERVVPLGPGLRRELAAEHRLRARGQLGSGWRYAVDPGSPWVFPAQQGGPMSADTVGAIITRALDGGTAHGLRRRFATRAYHGTRDLRAVQELLGHSSLATTQAYLAVDEDDMLAAVLAAA